MTDELLHLLDTDTTIALEDLLAHSGLAAEEVVELVEYGVFQPLGSGPAWTFASRTLVVARRAARLRDDFGLNPSGMALALAYVERIEELEQRLRELECRLLG